MLVRTIILWIIALLLTLASAYYQRITGPSHPLTGEVVFAGSTIEYELSRSNRGKGEQEVALIAPSASISGRAVFRRYTSDDAWGALPMNRKGNRLIVFLPEQPPAGKLEYYVELRSGSAQLRLPETGLVIARHTGPVPGWALLPHIIAIFLAMLFSARAGLEALFSDGKCRGYALWAFGTLILGGLVFGPLVQKYAFGTYWSGIPFGMDLTDNKTLIAFIAWLVAVFAVWNSNFTVNRPKRRWYVFAASIVTLLIFLIPHSLFGSELDYRKTDSGKPLTGIEATVVEATVAPHARS